MVRQYHGKRYMCYVGDILCVLNPFQLVDKRIINDFALQR